MAAGNTLKNRQNDDFIPESAKEEKDIMAKSKWTDVLFLRDERARKIAGLILIFYSLFLLVSFVSYLFSWKADQNIVAGFSWSQYLQINPEVAKNWLGPLGARSAFFYMHNGFGLSSFAFVLIFFTLGLRLLVGVTLLPLGKMYRYSFFTGIWFSLALSFLLSGSYSFLGGTFGYQGIRYLRGLMGYAGAGMFLLLYMLVFLVVVFNINFLSEQLLALFRKQSVPPQEGETDVLEEETEVQVEEEPEYDIEGAVVAEASEVESESEIAMSVTLAEEETTKEPEEESAPKEFSLSIDASVPGNKEQDEEEITLEIEETVGEELDEAAGNSERKEHYGLDTEFDPRLELASYQFPTIDLLKDYGVSKAEMDTAELESNKNLIVETLKNYNIAIAQIKAAVGPTVTLYEIVPEAGVRITKIKNLEDDIALSLAALGIRIIAPIPGKGTIGIEVPNKKPEMVPMRSVIASSKFQNNDMALPVILGKTISNEIFIADLAKMPHLLMAGATGQGKSVGINALLVSLLYKKHPAEVKFVLVDPKKVELTLYRTIERHFLAKLPGDGEAIITDTKLVTSTLNSLCVEMDKRYDLLKDAGVRNITEYNAKFLKRKLLPTEGHHFMPYIVVVIDELADLMMTAGKEVEYPIGRLAQLARAIGIHLILATQRPSVNVITGTIKANFPGRIAFRVTSKIDSRTILDGNGADQLIGKGDMLYSNGSEMIRLQCPFVDTPEVEVITEFIGNQRGYGSAFILPEVQDADGESGHEAFDAESRDALFEDAARIVVQTQQGSTSMLQRRLKLGYNRAGRLIDQLEAAGIVGPFEGSKAREVRLRDELELEQLLNELDNK
ncbi:MAG: DNA translocase FtsK [Bacteroidetes bacterium]|nr:DNA translocase FtsK [Bacteroidota bacterium]